MIRLLGEDSCAETGHCGEEGDKTQAGPAGKEGEEGAYQKVDLTGLRTCKTPRGYDGLTCSGADGGCLDRDDWCLMGLWTEITCKELGGLPPNHPAVCAGRDSWQQFPCSKYYEMCPTSGQCVYFGRFDKCWNGTEPCEKALTCKKNGHTVCLDPHLRCDMVPACDKGEDEEECEVEYRRRGFIDTSATMRCESPHHNHKKTPTVTIWAAPCNGRAECFQDLDEVGCDTGWVAYALLGKI